MAGTPPIRSCDKIRSDRKRACRHAFHLVLEDLQGGGAVDAGGLRHLAVLRDVQLHVVHLGLELLRDQLVEDGLEGPGQ